MTAEAPRPVLHTAAIALALAALAAPSFAQPPRVRPVEPAAPVASTDYVVGAQDVLMITSYDEADLSGKFTVEADGTFTFPFIGAFKAGGLTLRQVEDGLKEQLRVQGYFRSPQVRVSVEQYRSQKVFVVGEVRSPGPYAMVGQMNLIEALARAGSTLPTASGEVVVVHPAAGGQAAGPTLPAQDDAANVVRVDLRRLRSGLTATNEALQDGDTIFVPRAESVYVFGQVRNPGAYPLQQRDTTVLQALSLAGGVADRGSTSRVRVVRIVEGEKTELKVSLSDVVQPGDTIIVPERFF
jgi:polysaccharide export outer membrane protein